MCSSYSTIELKKDIFGPERIGGELLDLASYDVGFLDDAFPSISHARSTMKLLVAGDIGGLNTVVDSGSSPMVVDDSGSCTIILVTVRKRGRAMRGHVRRFLWMWIYLSGSPRST